MESKFFDMQRVISNSCDAVSIGIETIQDIVETMDDFEKKEFIMDMLQVIIAKHHHITEDMDDICKRYQVDADVRERYFSFGDY